MQGLQIHRLEPRKQAGRNDTAEVYKDIKEKREPLSTEASERSLLCMQRKQAIVSSRAADPTIPYTAHAPHRECDSRP